jgi:protein TonB
VPAFEWLIVSDRFAPPPSVLGLSRNVVIAGSVILFHGAALWALQSGLLRRAAEVVIPVEILSQFIEPPKPAAPPPPPPPPQPKREVVKAEPRPVAIREPKPTPAPNAPVGVVEPPAPSPAAPVEAPAPPAPPAPAPAPAPPAPRTIEISEGETQYIREPKLVFPSMSRRLGESGTTVVSIYFNSEGFAKRVEIFKSSGFDRLDEAALTAARTAQVTPFKQGNPQSTYLLRAPYTFKLN